MSVRSAGCVPLRSGRFCSLRRDAPMRRQQRRAGRDELTPREDSDARCERSGAEHTESGTAGGAARRCLLWEPNSRRSSDMGLARQINDYKVRRVPVPSRKCA